MSWARALVFSVLGLACGACQDQAAPPAPTPAAQGAPEVREFHSPTQLSGETPAAPLASAISLSLPDVTLTNQAGQEVRLLELVDGKIAVIQTIFTSCGTICPPMGSNFGRLQELVADQPDVVLISVSIDPITDIPERLEAWGERFGAGERWTLLTGSSEAIRTTLKALRTFSAEKQDHSSMVAIGHHDTGVWSRVDGLSDPKVLSNAVTSIRQQVAEREANRADNGPPVGAPANEIAHQYFTDVELVDQHGKTHRLYRDLLEGKVVVINSFFTSCEGVCPPMTKRLAELQSMLKDRMSTELHILSLSVDPITDTPARLAAYADDFEAGDGWLFLTGEKANVELALHKLGFSVEVREGHSNLFVIGNERTGLWKKAFGLAEPKALLEVVQSVLEDDGSQVQPGGPAQAG